MIMNGVLALLCVGGCALGMLLIATLLIGRNRSQANFLLACLIAVACVDVLFSAAEHLSQQPSASPLLRLASFPSLLFAPLLYLYCNAQVSGRALRIKDSWHAASFISLQCIAMLALATGGVVRWETAQIYLNLACVLVIGMYMLATVRIAKTPLSAQPRCSVFHDVTIGTAALLAALASYLFRAAAGAVLPGLSADTDAIADAVLSCSLAVLACSAIFHAIARTENVEANLLAPAEANDEPAKMKYGSNRLPGFVRESIIAELDRYMKSARPWLRVDLTLHQLAASIKVNPHHLSQIINSEFGKSFACYINEYRVNAACQSLSDPNNRTVLDIAFESGFASKSSFNALFKKHTGTTPSEYRRRFQKSDSLVA
jgi:AraC-like DNA-binding protein